MKAKITFKALFLGIFTECLQDLKAILISPQVYLEGALI